MRGVPIDPAEAAELFPEGKHVAIMAPSGLEDEVGGLDTIQDAIPMGDQQVPVIRSKWALDAEEIERLNRGGSVWLCSVGGQLPVAMQVLGGDA